MDVTEGYQKKTLMKVFQKKKRRKSNTGADAL